MKKLVFLGRHGESEGNVDKGVYEKKPDYAIRLTRKGVEDAWGLGHTVMDKFEARNWVPNLACLVSPYYRTRQTLYHASAALRERGADIWGAEESPLLREQEWNHGEGTKFNLQTEKDREKAGVFTYRFPGGENLGDCYNRAALFELDLRRVLDNNPAQGVLSVGHGMQNRIITMRLCRMSVDKFMQMRNQKNGTAILLEYDTTTKRFELLTDTGSRSGSKCDYRYDPYDIA